MEKIIVKCPNYGCGGVIIEEDRVVDIDEDLVDCMVCKCDKCGEDFTEEMYG